MRSLTIRVHVPPAVLLTLVSTTLLLLAAYAIAPEPMRLGLLVSASLMVALVAFTSVELTLYLLILSTLLSPELQFGGDAITGADTATSSRGVTLRLDDLQLTVICLTWIFRMAVYKELGAVRNTPINQPIAWYFLITVLATVAGFYSGRVGLYGFFFVLKYLEYFVLFYMIINQIHDKEAIHRYMNVMLFTCVVVCLLGIAQIPGGERVSAPFEGEMGEPNSFGGYLVLMFSVVMGMFLYEVDSAKRWYWGALLMLILIPLAFTESRTSYLAFLMMIVLFIIFSDHKRLLVGLCLAALSLAPFIVPKNIVDRVMFTFEQPEEAGQIALAGARIDTSTSERLEAWVKVITIDLPRHPLLGVGVTGGRFMDAQYPRVLSETGIIGLIMFLWWVRRMWVLLKICHRHLSDERMRGMSLGVLCGFGGLLFHALGSNTFIIVRIMEPLMILLGLLVAALLIQEQDQEREAESEAQTKGDEPVDAVRV